MDENETRMNQLREKRAKAQLLRDWDRLRALHGENFVAVITEATGRVLSLGDFDSKSEPWPIEWPADIRDATGLVAAHVSRSDCIKLWACGREKLSSLCGKIGFHEKPYLGFAALQGADPVTLLEVAEKTQDSVVFYNDSPSGIVMVDCYESQPTEPFSVVVQGDELVQLLTPCFNRRQPD